MDFDENFFVFWKMTTVKAKKKGFKSYQINTIKVSHNMI